MAEHAHTLTATSHAAPQVEADVQPGWLAEEELAEGFFPYPQPFFCGPGLVSAFVSGTPTWESAPFIGADDVEYAEARIKVYEKFNQWDDGTGAPGSAQEGTAVWGEERAIPGGRISTEYFLDGHTPAGPSYDPGPRLVNPITLHFPVTGYAAAGTTVILQVFNNTPDALYEPDPERHPGVTALGHYGEVDFVIGHDSKGNEVRPTSLNRKLGGVVAVEVDVVTALEPGDTIPVTIRPGPLAAPIEKVIPDDVGVPVLVRETRELTGGKGPEVLKEETRNFPDAMRQAKLWGGFFGAYPYGTLVELGGGLLPGFEWADGLSDPLWDKPPSELLPLYYKAVPHEIGVYGFATVFRNVGGELPTERREGSSPLDTGVKRSPQFTIGGNGYLAGATWTTGANPAGGDFENELNATSHGIHMISDFRYHGPKEQYVATGTGTGWSEVVDLGVFVKPKNQREEGEGLTSAHHEEPDTTFGVGPKGGPGRVVEVDVAGVGDVKADAQHLLSHRTTDNADLWWYFNWENQAMTTDDRNNGSIVLLESLWAAKVREIIKELYAEAPGGDVFENLKTVGPLKAELRLQITLDAATHTRWKMWEREGEDPIAIELELFGRGELLEGELLVNGVVVAGTPTEPRPLRASELAVGDVVEFRISTPIPAFPVFEWFYFGEAEKVEEETGLHHPGKEPFGRLRVEPGFGSSFNTLEYKWSVKFRLYFPPPVAKEEEELRVEENEEKEKAHEGKEEERKEEREREREKEIIEEEEDGSVEEKRQKEREREVEEEVEPKLEIDNTVSPRAKVSSNTVVGRQVPSRTSETEETGEGEFGHEEEGAPTSPEVALEFFAEEFLESPESIGEPYFSIWSCLQIPAKSGYRLVLEPTAPLSEDYAVHLERWVAGARTLLASASVTLPEEFIPLELNREGGNIVGLVNGLTVVTDSDATFTGGAAGIEGRERTDFGGVNFTQGGVLLDDLKRFENPLSGPHWKKLPWAEVIGQLISFGYIPNSSSPETGGAYWG